MAVFVDLDDEDVDPPHDGQPPYRSTGSEAAGGGAESRAQRADADRLNPNQNTMTRALGIYP